MPERNIGIWDDKPAGNQITIIGIDPGVTTGLSVLQFDPDSGVPAPQNISRWGSDQISYGGSGNVKDLYATDGGWAEQRIARKIGDVVRNQSPNRTFVVIEDFIIRRVDTSRDFLSPVRLTSGILQEIYDLDNVTVHFQSPSDAKGTCTDERMDKWGYTIETQKDRHSRDADRHAVLLLRKMMENPAKFNLIQYKAQP